MKSFHFCRSSLTAFIQRSKRRKKVIRTLGSSGLSIARFEQPSSVMNENGNCRILYSNFTIMIINNLHTVFQLEAQYSFLDYVMGGCQINFTVRSVMAQYLLLIAGVYFAVVYVLILSVGIMQNIKCRLYICGFMV